MAMPDIDRLYRSYGGKQVDFIILNCFDTDRQKIQELYRSFGYRFPIFFGEKALSQQLRVTSHPTLWVIDNSTRRIVYKHTGHSEENTQNLEDVLKSLNK